VSIRDEQRWRAQTTFRVGDKVHRKTSRGVDTRTVYLIAKGMGSGNYKLSFEDGESGFGGQVFEEKDFVKAYY